VHDLQGVPEVDLRTLLGAMAALKTEVRAVTEAARQSQRATDAGASVLADRLAQALQEAATQRSAAQAARRTAGLALIEVVDGLEAALAVAPGPGPALLALRQGLGLTLRGLKTRLTALGVSPVDVSAGFDAKHMEAVRAVYREDVPEGSVVDVVLPGWRWRETDAQMRPLRLAQVVVARSKTSNGASR
jgi:molecular chaperone GrpE (heat shock protein)